MYLFKKNIFMHSAQTAFYFLMSLFPFIYITTVILSFFSLSVVSFLDSLHYIFPSITFDVIYNNFLTIPLGFSSIRAILYSIIALWSSSMLFNSLKITFAESYPKDKLNNNYNRRCFRNSMFIFYRCQCWRRNKLYIKTPRFNTNFSLSNHINHDNNLCCWYGFIVYDFTT